MPWDAEPIALRALPRAKHSPAAASWAEVHRTPGLGEPRRRSARDSHSAPIRTPAPSPEQVRAAARTRQGPQPPHRCAGASLRTPWSPSIRSAELFMEDRRHRDSAAPRSRCRPHAAQRMRDKACIFHARSNDARISLPRTRRPRDARTVHVRCRRARGGPAGLLRPPARAHSHALVPRDRINSPLLVVTLG